MEKREFFKDKLRKLIDEKQITQETLELELRDIAAKNNYSNFSISAGTISNWVTGKRPLRNLTDAQCLADYFNVALLYIIDDNITEPQYEYIPVNEVLKISGKSIENIKTVSSNKEYVTMFNNFLENMDIVSVSHQMYRLLYYTNLFHELDKLSNIVKLENSIYILLNKESYSEIKKILEVFNKIFTDLDYYVLPEKIKKDNCIFEENNTFKDSSLINIENHYKELFNLFISKNYNDFRNNYYKIVKCIKEYREELFDRIKSIRYSIMEDMLNTINKYIPSIYGERLDYFEQIPELNEYYNIGG